MTGLRHVCLGVVWGLCALASVAVYASLAAEFARASSETVRHWVDGASGGYAILYAPMHGS